MPAPEPAASSQSAIVPVVPTQQDILLGLAHGLQEINTELYVVHREVRPAGTRACLKELTQLQVNEAYLHMEGPLA